MKALIANQSIIALGQWQRRLERHNITVVHKATALTDVYNYSEHHQPDCVIMPTNMADCAEFELLASLFAIMGIACVVVDCGDGSTLPEAARRANPAIKAISANMSDECLIAALQPTLHRPRKAIITISPETERSIDPRHVILIGSSTGGVDALMQVLRHFHQGTPPAVIVQHTGGQFADSLIRLLDGATSAKVVSAQHDMILRPGHVYLSSGDTHHLNLTSSVPPRIKLDASPRVSGHRPSVDALFCSAVSFAPHVTAAILTGMGRDGAEGIAALRKAGARTIGQDEVTSVVYGMPRVAKSLGGIELELPIQQIGPALLRGKIQRRRAS